MTVERGLRPAKEKNEAAEGRAIFGNSILGMPEIEHDLSCSDRNGKADAHASKVAEGHDATGRPTLGMGHGIPGNSILGTPEI